MDELVVRNIMQREVIAVGPEMTVKELAQLLAKHKISGVPVVDKDRQVVGIVSEADVIMQDAEFHFPYYIQFLESVIYLQSLAKFELPFHKAFGAKVADVMSSDVVTVEPDADVHEAATLMANHKVNRLPVVEDGKLVGILTRGDIVRAIAQKKA
jgi:CBS domain-containing protein